MPGRIVIILSVLLVVAAQVQLQPKPLTGIRGQNLTVTCSFPQSTTDIQLSVRGISILLIGSKFLGFSVRGNTAVEFRYGPLEASDDGAVFECDNTAGSADSASLDLLVPPEYSFNTSLSTTVLEGTSEYSYKFRLNNDVNPVPTNFTWRSGSEEISNSTRITITVNSITIRNVKRSDSGTYVVTATGIAGMATANFTLDVQYAPDFTGIASDRSIQLRRVSTLTFNCTPSDANPTSVTYSFRRNGTNFSVSRSVLIISSVVRGDSGNYSCTATNSAGSTTVYYGLLVVEPNNLPVIIGVVAGGVVFVLLVLIGISLCVICYIKFWRTRTYNTTAKDRVKEDCTYDQVLMSSGTVQNIQLDSNPAYQPMTIEPSVNDPTYQEIETKLQLTANPVACDSVD